MLLSLIISFACQVYLAIGAFRECQPTTIQTLHQTRERNFTAEHGASFQQEAEALIFRMVKHPVVPNTLSEQRYTQLQAERQQPAMQSVYDLRRVPTVYQPPPPEFHSRPHVPR